MGRFVAVSAVAAALLVFPSAALAGWSAPRVLSFAHYSSYANTAVAVDSRGDGAVAWESVGGWPAASQGRRCSPSPTRQGCFPLSSVHVAVRIAGGALVTRTLWSGRVDPTMHLSVVIGGASVTVAWGYSPAASELETVRAAYGPLAGRWSPSRAIEAFHRPGSLLRVPAAGACAQRSGPRGVECLCVLGLPVVRTTGSHRRVAVPGAGLRRGAGGSRCGAGSLPPVRCWRDRIHVQPLLRARAHRAGLQSPVQPGRHAHTGTGTGDEPRRRRRRPGALRPGSRERARMTRRSAARPAQCS